MLFTGRPAGRPVGVSENPRREARASTPDDTAGTSRARRAPARRELECLLGAAIGTGAARVSGELDRAQPLEKLPHTVGEERGHEDEVRHGDQYGEEPDPPPLTESRHRTPEALLAIERLKGDGAARSGALPVPIESGNHAPPPAPRPPPPPHASPPPPPPP